MQTSAFQLSPADAEARFQRLQGLLRPHAHQEDPRFRRSTGRRQGHPDREPRPELENALRCSLVSGNAEGRRSFARQHGHLHIDD